MSVVGTAPASATHPYRVTFSRLIHAEWIKLWTIRSTWWTLGTTVLLMLLNSLAAALIVANIDSDSLPFRNAAEIITLGASFAQLSLAVVACLVITGEYSTGMIRSSFSADPKRLPTLTAKAVALKAAAIITVLISYLLAFAISAAILAGTSLSLDLGDSDTWRVLGGALLGLVLVTLMAFAIGVCVRHSAGAIAIVMGLLFVIPVILGVIAGLSGKDWLMEAIAYLPGSAAGALSALNADVSTPGVIGFGPALLALLAWVAIPSIIGALLVRHRDV